jgi:hypothetical protein
MRVLLATLAIGTAFVAGFIAWTWFTPWEMVDAGICSESPLGYYQARIVAYELTAYAGAEVQDWLVVGTTRDFVNFYLFGAELC